MDTALNNFELDRIFHALSDSTRRTILGMLAQKSLAVGDIASHFSISLNGISKHLKVLETAGLLIRKKAGRTHYCKSNPTPLQGAHNFIEFYQQFWGAQLDSLEEFFIKNEDKRE